MPLVECRECKAPIFDAAPNCPPCGAPRSVRSDKSTGAPVEAGSVTCDGCGDAQASWALVSVRDGQSAWWKVAVATAAGIAILIYAATSTDLWLITIAIACLLYAAIGAWMNLSPDQRAVQLSCATCKTLKILKVPRFNKRFPGVLETGR